MVGRPDLSRAIRIPEPPPPARAARFDDVGERLRRLARRPQPRTVARKTWSRFDEPVAFVAVWLERAGRVPFGGEHLLQLEHAWNSKQVAQQRRSLSALTLERDALSAERNAVIVARDAVAAERDHALEQMRARYMYEALQYTLGLVHTAVLLDVKLCKKILGLLGHNRDGRAHELAHAKPASLFSL